MISDIFSQFFEICIFFLYFTLFGITLRRFINNNYAPSPDLIQLNLLGLFANSICISIWNIFFPINNYFGLVFIIAGFLFIPSFITRIQIYKYILRLKSILFIPFLIQLTFMIWIGNRSLALLQYEPMYHVQKIKWAQEYHLIRGLGNLFSHFGLDSGYFLNVAFLDSISFISHAFWNLSGYLLVLGFLYFFVMPFYCIINDKCSILASDIMKLLFTPILIHNTFYMHPGLGTDLPVFIFGSILAIEMFRLFFEGEKNIDIILICIFLGFSSKMSFLPTTILTILVLIIAYFNGIGMILRHKLLLLLVIIAFSVQFHRNITLTGYPFYPFEHISVPVEWKIDSDIVSKLSNDISNWAKGVRDVMTPKEINEVKDKWVKSRLFLQHKRVETLYPLSIAILSFIFIAIMKRFNRTLSKSLRWKIIFIYLLPPFAQIGMWYFYAPDPRFASFAFWWLGAGMGSLVIKEMITKPFHLILSLIILFASFSLHTIDILGQKKKLLIYKTSQLVPEVPLSKQMFTKSNMGIWVPNNGVQCDNSPLPCTQTFTSDLDFINGEDIKSGFKK